MAGRVLPENGMVGADVKFDRIRRITGYLVGTIASCAAKIAEAVDAGIIGYYMAKRGQNFDDGDGIVTAGIEATIRNVGRLAKEGMKETNDEIINIMIGS